jgi:hypothetical protein
LKLPHGAFVDDDIGMLFEQIYFIAVAVTLGNDLAKQGAYRQVRDAL